MNESMFKKITKYLPMFRVYNLYTFGSTFRLHWQRRRSPIVNWTFGFGCAFSVRLGTSKRSVWISLAPPRQLEICISKIAASSLGFCAWHTEAANAESGKSQEPYIFHKYIYIVCFEKAHSRPLKYFIVQKRHSAAYLLNVSAKTQFNLLFVIANLA